MISNFTLQPSNFYRSASCSAEKTPEIDAVLNLLERIYEDGVVTPDEHNELMAMLKSSFQT